MSSMRRTTAASILALGGFVLPAHAQQIIYNDPAYQPPGQVFQPQQPFGNQPVYIDPNTGQPIVQQPNFGQPLPQPGFAQPQQQPNFGQPLPQPGFGAALPQPAQNFGQPPQPPQPNFGQPLPQPQQTYNPTQQPAIATAPEGAVPQQGTVPYYERTGSTTAPTPSTPEDVEVNAPEAAGSLATSPSSPSADQFAPVATNGGSDRAPQMSSELDELLRVGERYRAASPGFLEDLKALASKYRDPLPQAPAAVAVDPFGIDPDDQGETDLASTGTDLTLDPASDPALAPETSGGVGTLGPIQEVVTSVPPLDPGSTTFAYIEDDFTDGELANNPPWRIRQGDWSVDPKFGLRAKPTEQASDKPIKPKELLKALLTGDAPDSEQSSAPRAALIESQTSIGNAFSFAARIVDHSGTGTAHFIMHQGGSNWLGYRLELRSGPQPVVVLTRRGSNGYKDITKVAAPGFTKGEQHELRWARLSDGQMLVILNGRPIITSRDTVFREDWKGFAFFNAGGDVSIRALRISAPVER